MDAAALEYIRADDLRESAVRIRLPRPEGDRFIRVTLRRLQSFDPNLIDDERQMLDAFRKYWSKIIPGHQMETTSLVPGGELIL